jgi:hypothetical protein
MAIAYNTSIVRDGLVLYLDAANPKSYPGTGTTVFDLKGAVNSTLYNGVSFDSSNKGSFSFDGVNDYTQINVSTSAGSIAFWYYYNGTNIQSLIMGNSSSMLYNGGGVGTIHWYNWSADYSFVINIGSTARWLYITLTYTSNTVNNLYVNDILLSSSTSYNISKGDGVYNVAGNFYSPQNCKIALIKTYNKALSLNEIKQNFNATRGRYGI